jgi:hypothetical protein
LLLSRITEVAQDCRQSRASNPGHISLKILLGFFRLGIYKSVWFFLCLKYTLNEWPANKLLLSLAMLETGLPVTGPNLFTLEANDAVYYSF